MRSRSEAPDDTQLQTLAKYLAKKVKSQKDLSDLTRKFVKMTVEAALNSEMEEHPGYAKNAPQGHNTGNNGNGHSCQSASKFNPPSASKNDPPSALLKAVS